MAKARVYELAKELGVGNKEILEQLKKKNVEVKNHMSTVEDNVAEEIRRENAGRNEEPAKAEPAAEKAAEKDSGVPKKKTWQKILEEKQLAKMLRWLQIKQQKKRVLQRRKILHL